MDLGPLRALALQLNFAAHGVDAIVTRPAPNDDPIETRAIWVTPVPEAWPGATDLQRQDPRRILAFRRDEVPTLPRGTRVTAPPKAGDADAGWIVDGIDRSEADHVRAIVLPDPDWWAS